MTKVHDFQESLQKSKDREDSPFWFEIYKHYFPNLAVEVPVTEDCPAQRAGVDRSLVLTNSTVIRIEEKVRQKKYDDILLEYLSSKELGTEGWMEKDLSCQFLVYIIVPSRKCYLLPNQLLRRAWRENKIVWISRYRRIEARNNGYTTVSVAVPIEEIERAIVEAMLVTWPESLELD